MFYKEGSESSIVNQFVFRTAISFICSMRRRGDAYYGAVGYAN